MKKVSVVTIFSGYPNVTIKRLESQVERGLDFIFKHVETPDWPRNISTRLTDNKQITVYSRIEALSYFKEARYLDCRISAYAPDSKRLSIAMIDTDLENFKSKREFNKAHVEILSNIYRAFGKRRMSSISPVTVLFTGHGNHYLIPLGSIRERGANCKEFLQFIERYLSNGKCDLQHNKVTSFKNCLLRIPGSINSDGMVHVKILHRWNGKSKLDLSPLYDKFKHDNYRKSTKKAVKPPILIKNSRLARQVKMLEQFCQQRDHSNIKHDNNFIPWIETLLQIPIAESRKYAGWRILAPYLINVRHLSDDDAFAVIDRWLSKCNKAQELDFDVNTKVNSWLDGAANKGYFPISFDNPDKEPRTLKIENRQLYNIILTRLGRHK
jgi:hypothetical protein